MKRWERNRAAWPVWNPAGRNRPIVPIQLELCAWMHVVSTSLYLEAIAHHVSARPHARSAPWTLAAFPAPSTPVSSETSRTESARCGWLGAYTHLSLRHRRQSRNPSSSSLHVSRFARYGHGLRKLPIPNACQCASSSAPWRTPFGDPVIGHPLAQKKHAMRINHGPRGDVIGLGGFLHPPVAGPCRSVIVLTRAV